MLGIPEIDEGLPLLLNWKDLNRPEAGMVIHAF